MQIKKKLIKRKTVALNTTIPPKTDEQMRALIHDGHYTSKSDVISAGVDRLHASKMRGTEGTRQ
jgi:Arc/MetJ-type ribon-helix-helix transcriptional regulator